MTTFIKFEHYDFGIAAVFDCYGREIRLCKESLEQRINNLKHQDLPCNVEMSVLTEMNRIITNNAV